MTTLPEPELLQPVPAEDGPPFFAYAARGELRVQTCTGCGEPRFPPRPCCPQCQSFDSLWTRTSGRGRIWSYVLPPPAPGRARRGALTAGAAMTVAGETRDGGVAVVTLDRPELHNAIDLATAAELASVWRRLRGDESVRAVVLTGAGERGVCTGVDRSVPVPRRPPP